MDHFEHPCASLPKYHVSAHLVYCGHHMAWSLSAHVYLEDGDRISDVVPFTAVNFGPFDGAEDVTSEACRRLAAHVAELVSGLGH